MKNNFTANRFAYGMHMVPMCMLAALALLAPLAVSASTTLGTANTTALSSGLVGYWPLDGATTNWSTGITRDVSGQGNSESLISLSTTTSPTIGKIGQALKFNGSTSYTQGSTPYTGVANWTLSEWIRPAVLPQAVSLSIYNGNDAGGYGFGVGDGVGGTGSKLQVLFGSVAWLDPSFTLTAGKWYHVVMTRDSGTTRVYVNGTLLATTFANTPGTVVNKFTIGMQPNGASSPTRFFNGTADDARIYNRALSATEVALLYASGNANAAHSASGPSAPLSSGLVGYWTFDGSKTQSTIADSSGQGNNAYIATGGAATSSMKVGGKLGQGLNFNGATYLVAPPISLSRYSVSAWVKPNGNQVGSAAIVADAYPGYVNYVIGFNPGTTNVFAGTYSGGWYQTGAVTLASGKWSLVTSTFDGSFINLYVNGAYASQVAAAITPQSSGTQLRIGRRWDLADYFNGSIDDVRIYNRALSAQEVAQLYASGNTNVSHSNGNILSSGLVGYWTFDGSNINWKTGTIIDSSGNGNNGSPVSLGTTTSPTIGKIGQALKFNGSNYIDAGNGSSVDITGNQLSIAMWVRPAGTGYCLVDKNRNTAYHTQLLNQNKFDFRVNTTEITGGTTISAGKWYHLVGTYDGSNLRVYVNGQSDATPVVRTGNINSASQHLLIGECGDGYNFAGSMDDVRIYNRALSAQEIQQLYLLGK